MLVLLLYCFYFVFFCFFSFTCTFTETLPVALYNNCLCFWSQSVILCYWLVRHFIDVQFLFVRFCYCFVYVVATYTCTYRGLWCVLNIVGASIVLCFAYSSRISKAQWVHIGIPVRLMVCAWTCLCVRGFLHTSIWDSVSKIGQWLPLFLFSACWLQLKCIYVHCCRNIDAL